MQNYFQRLPKELRSRNSLIIPLISIGVAFIGIFSIVSFVSDNYDIRKQAATTKTTPLPPGCYYVRGNCTDSEMPNSADGNCRPILICPSATPTFTQEYMPL